MGDGDDCGGVGGVDGPARVHDPSKRLSRLPEEEKVVFSPTFRCAAPSYSMRAVKYSKQVSAKP